MAVEWDREADIVVVGFGGAGGATAIHAADHGANVLLLEKQPKDWHTPSTRASGGQIMSVSNAEDATRYMDRCAGGLVPTKVTRAWAERATDVVEWVQKVVGLDLVRLTGAEHPDWDGADAVSAYVARASQIPPLARPGGAFLFAALEKAVQSRERIAVTYETRAERLVTDDEGAVIGVVATQGAEVRRFKAGRGVVLTSGGYEYNEDMKRSYLRSYPTYFYSSPMSTGDGVRMAQALGADLWHMNSMIGRGVAHFEAGGREYNYLVSLDPSFRREIHPPGGYVLLDGHGRRFANEYMQAAHRHDFYFELINFDSGRSEYPRVPCYWIFDDRRMQAGPLMLGSAAAGPYHYEWSAGSSDEIARGWVKMGERLEGLFESTGITEPDEAVRSVLDYNAGCMRLTDSFGRPPESLVPLDTPPYYCIELWPGGPNTTGGPRRNEHAQVIDVFGDPISGLYEAGELGEAVGALYPANGANLSDALCFGRIAAEHALGGGTPSDHGSRI